MENLKFEKTNKRTISVRELENQQYVGAPRKREYIILKKKKGTTKKVIWLQEKSSFLQSQRQINQQHNGSASNYNNRTYCLNQPKSCCRYLKIISKTKNIQSILSSLSTIRYNTSWKSNIPVIQLSLSKSWQNMKKNQKTDLRDRMQQKTREAAYQLQRSEECKQNFLSSTTEKENN